jgi:hypothetical protein
MVYRSPNEWVTGYSSRTMSGRYVLFMDFDYLDLNSITNEIRYLQEKYRLSDFYIFKLDRKNSYHAVCLDAQSMNETYTILKDSSCDQAFIHAIKNMESREWVLRLGKKGERKPVKYLCHISSNYYQKTRSSAHAAMLKKLGVRINSDYFGKWDGHRKIALVKYNTASRTFIN